MELVLLQVHIYCFAIQCGLQRTLTNLVVALLQTSIPWLELSVRVAFQTERVIVVSNVRSRLSCPE